MFLCMFLFFRDGGGVQGTPATGKYRSWFRFIGFGFCFWFLVSCFLVFGFLFNSLLVSGFNGFEFYGLLDSF